MKTFDRVLGLIAAASNIIYAVWLFTAARGYLGLIFAIAESMIVSLSVIFIINHWKRQSNDPPKSMPSASLDIFLPVVDEPIKMFEKTLLAASKIEYVDKRLYVLDDGGRGEIKKLSKAFGATYLGREKIKERKAGNLNFGLKNSIGEIILVLDADQEAEPNIASDLLGYFNDDEKLAIVTTRQRFKAPPGDFNHDTLFYESMQQGKNSDNAAISCGSGVFYKRRALEEIGGFQTWNYVEDLYTSYVMHQRGYKSLYVNRPYTTGNAPRDVEFIIKQRGNWAFDTLRLFIYRNPLFAKGLTFAQKLHYFEIGWAYMVSALALTIVFLFPPISLIFGIYMISDPLSYIVLRAPSIMLIILLYYRLSGNTLSTCQFWASLSPVYLFALIRAIRRPDISDNSGTNVNPKAEFARKRNIMLVMPQIAYIAFSIGAVIYRIFVDKALTSFIGINTLWIIIMVVWLTPIIKRELTGCHYCSYEQLMNA